MTAHDWQPHVYDDRAPEALYGHPSTMRCARRGHELAARAEIGSEHSTPPYDPTAPCVGAGDP